MVEGAIRFQNKWLEFEDFLARWSDQRPNYDRSVDQGRNMIIYLYTEHVYTIEEI